MFRKFNASATVYRQAYVTDGGYSKSGYSSTGKTYFGHLKAVKPESDVFLESFGKDFSFRTIEDADIKESDRLLIGSTNYEVKGVAYHFGVTFSMLDILLRKVDDDGN